MKRSGNLTVKIILGIFLLAAVIFLVVLLFPRPFPQNPPGTVGNTAGNLNNNGLFCEHDGIVYFSNPYDGGALYSMSPNETDMKLLIKANVQSINAAGDYLYFYQSGTGSGSGLGAIRSISGIYRATKKGSDIVCLNRDPSGILALADNALYYQHYDKERAAVGLTRTVLDKKDKHESTELTQTAINPAGMYQSLLYYSGVEENHFLYAYNTLTGATSLVWEYDIWNPVAQGDLIYFMDVHNNYRLCTYSLTTGEMKVLTEDRVDLFNVLGETVVYQKNSADAPALKRITMDNGAPVSEEVIAEGNFSNLNMTSQFIYYTQFDEDFPIYKTSTYDSVNVTAFDAAKAAVSLDS